MFDIALRPMVPVGIGWPPVLYLTKYVCICTVRSKGIQYIHLGLYILMEVNSAGFRVRIEKNTRVNDLLQIQKICSTDTDS